MLTKSELEEMLASTGTCRIERTKSTTDKDKLARLSKKSGALRNFRAKIAHNDGILPCSSRNYRAKPCSEDLGSCNVCGI